jgi:predicted  nucleic acid-binding Zn-ribbon protein
MTSRLTKTLIIILTLAAALLALMPLGVSADDASTSQIDASSVISAKLTAYTNISAYGGPTLNTGLECNDILDVKITSHGGIMKDGHGRLSFANYATLSIALKTEDHSMNIPGTGATIISERDFSYNGMHVGKDKKQELDTMIGYGVILTSCEAADGTREVSEEMYVRHYSDRVDGIRLTKDGDYHIVVLMTVKEGGAKKKIALEYEIPVRTSIYLTDEGGDYHVKNVGSYYDAVRLDALGRPGASITVDGVPVNDGYVLSALGKHKIQVYGNGYLCESFNFEIFSADTSHAHIYLSNSRAKLDDISYECENNFKVSWYSAYAAKVTYWKNNNPKEVFDYTAGTVITEPGYYVFTLNVPELANEKNTFLVKLVNNDSPTHNLNTLNANRFNNFRSKWYEVYDRENDLYYCFATNEYTKAYDAAITIEHSTTTDYGHYVLYAGKKYTDTAALTQAMSDAATKNVRTVYYDPSESGIEKYFSDAAFDGTIYLNRDFMFVRTSPAETNSVYLTDTQGNRTDIAFFTPISAYNLASGKYTVTETDLYGNKTEYEVTVDGIVPGLTLNLDDESTVAVDRNLYTASYFSLESILDELDNYAIVSVFREGGEKTDRYLASECGSKIYTEVGTYTLRVYDRNGNSARFMVNIGAKDKQYVLSETDSAISITLTAPGNKFTELYVNGTKKDFDESATFLTFAKTEEDSVITVYTEDESGKRDCASFSLKTAATDTDNENDDTVQGDSSKQDENDTGKMTLDVATIVIFAVGAFMLLAAIIIVKIIWRKNNG